MQSMIFAAGKGTRLKPLTDFIPKALVPVADKPLLQHVMDKLKSAGAQRVVVNIHHHAEQIRNFLQMANLYYAFDLRISSEEELLLETGGGIKKALPLFNVNEPVLIHNVDILSNANLEEFYRQSMGYDAALLVSKRDTQRYLLFSSDMRLVGWVNIATGQVKSPYPEIRAMEGNVTKIKEYFKERMFAFSGIHSIAPTMFRAIEASEDIFPIMDFYLANCDSYDIRGIHYPELRLLDVGKVNTLAGADEFITTLNS